MLQLWIQEFLILCLVLLFFVVVVVIDESAAHGLIDVAVHVLLIVN